MTSTSITSDGECDDIEKEVSNTYPNMGTSGMVEMLEPRDLPTRTDGSICRIVRNGRSISIQRN
jgi:hypothetical protein